jgi:hypothetical protein
VKDIEDITIDDLFRIALLVVLLGVALGVVFCFAAAADGQAAHCRSDRPAKVYQKTGEAWGPLRRSR